MRAEVSKHHPEQTQIQDSGELEGDTEAEAEGIHDVEEGQRNW